MRKFWGYTSNGKFSVGCSGQTVYLYDENDTEIKKFKDITYAYTPIISPDGKIFVVKSTGGMLAVYSLETLSLIKKFRFSKVDGGQDDGFCFSPDGQLFINIERQKNSLHSAISFYDTTDFSLVNQILISNNMMLSHIEYDKNTGEYYVLGFIRDKKRVFDYGFVAKLENQQIQSITAISEKEYDLYHHYKDLEMMGFTEKTYEWSYITDYKLDELKSMGLTLAKLYKEKTAR